MTEIRPQHPRALIRAALLALALASVTLPAAARADQLQSSDATVTFTGSGTYAFNQSFSDSDGTETQSATDQLQWTVTWHTKLNPDGTLAPASGTFSGAPGDYQFSETETASDGSGNVTCSGNLTQSGQAGAPLLTVSGAAGNQVLDAQSGILPSPDPSAFSNCLFEPSPPSVNPGPQMAAGGVAGLLSQALPDALTAHLALSPGALVSGTFSQPVTQANAKAPLSSDCTSAFPGSCSQSLTWSGTLMVNAACPGPKISHVFAQTPGGFDGHELTSAERQAIGLPDDSLHPGQQIRTDSTHQQVTIEFDDGASISGIPVQIDVPADCMTNWPERDKVILILPARGDEEIYDDFRHGADNFGWTGFYGPSEPTIANGSRGAQYTVTDIGTLGHPVMLMHVIEGTGWVDRPGKPEFHVPAGESVEIATNGSTALTSLWPARASALLAPNARPPAISALRLAGAASGRRARLSFRLDQPARVTVLIVRGRKVVARRSLNARRGVNVVHPLRTSLRHGRYVLRLTATRQKRVSIATRTFSA